MNRRSFAGASVLCLLGFPGVARAQQTKAQYRIGLVLTTSPLAEMLGPEPIHPSIRAFIHELRRLGYAEGQNLVLDRRSAEGKFERFGEIIAELLRLKPDVLVTLGGPMALAAGRLTKTVPIISLGVEDPVAAGVVTNLARPGANITGIASTAGPEFSAKRLEFFKAAVPSVTKVAYLAHKSDWESTHGKAARAAAQQLGLAMFHAESQPDDYSGGFAVIRNERPNGVFVGGHIFDWVNRQVIVDTLNGLRLPNCHGYSASCEVGGLMSYANADNTFVGAAAYVDKILKGAKPGDLPIEQPTRFELVVNLKTARKLGITFPQSFLIRVDRVIE